MGWLLVALGTPAYVFGLRRACTRRAHHPLIPAWVAGLVAAFFVAVVVVLYGDYYGESVVRRESHPAHAFLAPRAGLGLLSGALSLLCVAWNATRPARHALGLPSNLAVHAALGLTAVPLAVLHSGLSADRTAGGYGLVALLAMTGVGLLRHARRVRPNGATLLGDLRLLTPALHPRAPAVEPLSSTRRSTRRATRALSLLTAILIGAHVLSALIRG